MYSAMEHFKTCKLLSKMNAENKGNIKTESIKIKM